MKRTQQRSAIERLGAARAAQAAVAQQIKDVDAARSAALLDDDGGAAERADRELAELRLAAKRLVDKIELLAPHADAERNAEGWPQAPAVARGLLDHWEARQRMLARVPMEDRTADIRWEIDDLLTRVPAMRLHVQRLEQMNGKTAAQEGAA